MGLTILHYGRKIADMWWIGDDSQPRFYRCLNLTVFEALACLYHGFSDANVVKGDFLSGIYKKHNRRFII